MTIREQIIKEVATTEDDQLLEEVLRFLAQRQATAGQLRPGSFEAFMALEGTLPDEDAREMTTIIEREFSSPEGEW